MNTKIETLIDELCAAIVKSPCMLPDEVVAPINNLIAALRAQAEQQAQPRVKPNPMDKFNVVKLSAKYDTPPAAGMVMVPVEPAEEMWGELARDIMFVLRRVAPKPKDIFYHLEHLGRDIPQWLRDEPEMKNLDHTISKGTCCVLIYKAMIAASQKENNHGL